MEDAARLLQLVVNGAAAGCIYGLIALGFVLIYKATELVNFAQGDIMMLGGFFAFALIAHFGLAENEAASVGDIGQGCVYVFDGGSMARHD